MAGCLGGGGCGQDLNGDLLFGERRSGGDGRGGDEFARYEAAEMAAFTDQDYYSGMSEAACEGGRGFKIVRRADGYLGDPMRLNRDGHGKGEGGRGAALGREVSKGFRRRLASAGWKQHEDAKAAVHEFRRRRDRRGCRSRALWRWGCRCGSGGEAATPTSM